MVAARARGVGLRVELLLAALARLWVFVLGWRWGAEEGGKGGRSIDMVPDSADEAARALTPPTPINQPPDRSAAAHTQLYHRTFMSAEGGKALSRSRFKPSISLFARGAARGCVSRGAAREGVCTRRRRATSGCWSRRRLSMNQPIKWLRMGQDACLGLLLVFGYAWVSQYQIGLLSNAHTHTRPEVEPRGVGEGLGGLSGSALTRRRRRRHAAGCSKAAGVGVKRRGGYRFHIMPKIARRWGPLDPPTAPHARSKVSA